MMCGVIRTKSASEIECIAKASDVLTSVLDTVCAAVRPGVSTKYLDGVAASAIAARGAHPSFLGYHGYPASLCTSVDDTIIHGIPNDQPLREGQVIGVDCGVRYEGYWSDAARMVAVGGVSAPVANLIVHTKEALLAGIAEARPSNRVSDISRAIFAVAQRHHYGVVRDYCGHGVGFAVHEEPSIPNYTMRGLNPRLKKGMVLAIEPMFTLGGGAVYVGEDLWSVISCDHSVAAHWEHTIVIEEGGPRVLTPERPSDTRAIR